MNQRTKERWGGIDLSVTAFLPHPFGCRRAS